MWAAFHVIDSAAPYLSKRFDDAHFAFHNRELAGQPEQRPRWKRAVGLVNGVARRIGRPDLRRRVLSCAIQGQNGGSGRRSANCSGRTNPKAGVDKFRQTKTKALEKLVQAEGQDRLSRQVA